MLRSLSEPPSVPITTFSSALSAFLRALTVSFPPVTVRVPSAFMPCLLFPETVSEPPPVIVRSPLEFRQALGFSASRSVSASELAVPSASTRVTSVSLFALNGAVVVLVSLSPLNTTVTSVSPFFITMLPSLQLPEKT